MPQTFSTQEGIMLSQLWKFFLGILFPGGLIFLTAIGFLRPPGTSTVATPANCSPAVYRPHLWAHLRMALCQ